MRFEDQPSGDQPGTGAVPPPPPPAPEPGFRRRRSSRSWANPPAPAAPPPPPPAPSRFTRPASERDWSAVPRRGTDPAGGPAADRPPLPQTAIGAVPVDLSPVLRQLRDLRADLDQLRSVVTAATGPRDATMVTGPELAASIDALGTTLGNGMATLLTEHRNLLARDVDAAADRILEELAQRLRAGATQTADAVEERQRQVLAKALSDLGEQLDLRLEQLQSDMAGLRAVMLELPDQTAISERLDHLVEGVAATRNLTTEVAALRRRITARADRADEGLSDELLDDLADRVAARLRSATRAPARVLPEIEVDAGADEAADEDEGVEPDRPARPAAKKGRRRSS